VLSSVWESRVLLPRQRRVQAFVGCTALPSYLFEDRRIMTERASKPLAEERGPQARVVLQSDPEAARVGRDFVRDACIRWHVEAVSDTAMLVVSELVTNAMTHGRPHITVGLRLGADHLLIEVEDEDSQLPVLRHPSWDAVSGRGLVLIDGLARRWGSQCCPDGKVVWAELSLAG
jgi:anti-sigma regulatory factor (Ser/Thr protein kinase)